ncbi:MAG TPA: tetratricopeptide repeat protein [Phycisphaerales bacterium]|nr:tetratricopeptide repeat protein [Phycisphaerales bacterium]
MAPTTPESQAAPRHFKALATAALAGLLILLIAVTVQKLWSADFWWQLKNGEWILANRRVPDTLMYSHTAPNEPVREMRWLYSIIITWLWQGGGGALLVLFQAALVTLTFWIIVWPVRRVLLTPLGLLAVGLALLAGFNRWVVRPELLTYVFSAAFLVILERATRDGLSRGSRALWLLPLFQIIWTNTHSTFVFGPLLAWTFLGSQWLQSRLRATSPSTAAPTRNLLIVALLTTAACWMNPYGHWGAMYALEVFRLTQPGHTTARVITEMVSPFKVRFADWGWDFWAAAILSALAVLTYLPVRRLAPISRAVILLMSLYLLATLQRNLGIGAVLLAWVATRNCADLAAVPHTLKLRDSQPAHLASAALGLLFAITGWHIATDRYSVARSLPREFGLGVVEWYQPRGAEQFILQHKPQGNLFNIVRDGSYFTWRVSDVLPVMIDGRIEYGQEILRDVSGAAPATWNALTTKYNLGTAVIPTANYADLASFLYTSPDWALVSLDATSYVFLRNTPQNAPLIAQHRIDVNRWQPPATEPDDTVPAWKAAYGGVGRAWYNAGLANALAALDGHAAAIPYYEKAVANAPTVRRHKLALAPYYIVSGKSAEAETLLAGVSRNELADVDRTTAGLLAQAGQIPAAIAPAQRALDVYTGDHTLRIFTADLYFQTGNFAKARDMYTLALKDGVGSWNELNKLAHAHEQTGNLQEAARAYRASLEGEPRQPTIWNMAGELAARMGDFAWSKKCFETAIRLNPDSQRARTNLQQLNQHLANSEQPSHPPAPTTPQPQPPPPK